MGPLLIYLVLALIVAFYGRRICHGFWRIWALGMAFTPWLTFLYLLMLERRLARSLPAR